MCNSIDFRSGDFRSGARLLSVLACTIGLIAANPAKAAPIVAPTGEIIGHVTLQPGDDLAAGPVTWVRDAVVVEQAGVYRFTYAPTDPLALAIPRGPGVLLVEFWVGPTREAAEAAGNFFCIRPIPSLCSESPRGATFTVKLGHAVPFGYVYDQSLSFVPYALSNAWLDEPGSEPFAVPVPLAFAGSAAEPAAASSQSDEVGAVDSPEPSGLLLFISGLATLAILMGGARLAGH